MQAIKPNLLISVISIEHAASAVFVGFRLVLSFRERKNFIRFSLNI